MQGTLWPAILRTDSATSAFVERDVLWLSKSMRVGSLLVLIAGIISPLGLNDVIKPGSRQLVNFEYAKDESSFGLATPLRPSLPFSRRCYHEYCPGSSDVSYSVNNHSYDSHIPANLTRIFSSGILEVSPISGLFDMQYRLWTTKINFDANNGTGEHYPLGTYRTVQSLLHHNTTMVVEGLIVDTTSGGVG